MQTDLAASIQHLVDEEAAAARGGREAGLVAARDAFYRGDLARAMVRYHEENGGWLTMEDLAEYESAVEEPVRVRLGEIEVHTCGAWCQGPVLAQMASLLDGIDLAALGHNGADYIHTITEAMKLSFADRERHYGDPRFVDVPLERLLSDAYRRERRALIRPDQAWPGMPPAGLTGEREAQEARRAAENADPAAEPAPASADTSYCAAVDRHGNCFSATPSDVSFESPVMPRHRLLSVLARLAVVGGSRAMRRRSPRASARASPRTPAFARWPGRKVMPFGTPGGDVQTQAMLQVLLNVARFGMSTQDAVEAPRFATHSFPNSFEPHESLPGRLTVEGRIPEAVARDPRRARPRRRAARGLVAPHGRGVRDPARSRDRDHGRRGGPAAHEPRDGGADAKMRAGRRGGPTRGPFGNGPPPLRPHTRGPGAELRRPARRT